MATAPSYPEGKAQTQLPGHGLDTFTGRAELAWRQPAGVPEGSRRGHQPAQHTAGRPVKPNTNSLNRQFCAA